MSRKLALIVGLGVFLWPAFTLAQKPAWKAEHRDILLIAPKAKNVTYKEVTVNGVYGPRERVEITYTVAAPYPGTDVISQLHQQLKLKGCGLDSPDGSLPAIPQPDADYILMSNWHCPNREGVSYVLDYPATKDVKHLKTLQVHAYYGQDPPPVRTEPPAYAPSPRPTVWRQLSIAGLLLLYLLVIVGTPFLTVRRNLDAAVFYGGPGAWLTSMNLGFFVPGVFVFVSLGGVLTGALSGSFAAGVFGLPMILSWYVLMICSFIGYAACGAIGVALTGILLKKSIPRTVKATHAVIGLLSLGFFIFCLVARFDQPLIRW